MTQSKDKITKIIKALLAKAAGTDNEAEADIFAAKAHAVMEQYQVEVGDVLKDDPIDRNKPYAATTSSPSYKKFLWRSLARYYGCQTMLNWSSHTEYEIHIIGRESSRVTAELMMPFVMDQVRTAGRLVASSTGEKVEACVRDVANALVLRLNKLIAEQEKNEPTPATRSGKNALVAVNAINQLMTQLYPRAKSGGGRSIGTSDAARGAAAGISLSRQMGGSDTKRIK